MSIWTGLLFLCLGFAIGWLVFVGFTADPPRDDRKSDR